MGDAKVIIVAGNSAFQIVSTETDDELTAVARRSVVADTIAWFLHKAVRGYYSGYKWQLSLEKTMPKLG